MRWIAVVLSVLVACGDDGGGDPGVDAGPSTDQPLRMQWELVTASGPTSRDEAYLGSLGGKVVLFGGRGGPTGFLSDTWVFDAGAWTQLAPATSPFGRANGVLIEHGGRAILTGGVGRPPSGSIQVVGETWAFDGATWSELAGVAIPGRQGLSGAVAGDRVVVFGGSTTSVGRLDDGYALGASGAWTELPKAPAARRDASMTAVGDVAYLTGGSTPGASDEVIRIDGAAWETVGTLPLGGRAYHSTGALAGRVVVFGGVRTSTTMITSLDAWPGGAELVGTEPMTGGPMVTIGDSILMWRPTTDGMPGELWKLTVAP
jgi:hypothetical protein